MTIEEKIKKVKEILEVCDVHNFGDMQEIIIDALKVYIDVLKVEVEKHNQAIEETQSQE